jgi:hypothetical protein
LPIGRGATPYDWAAAILGFAVFLSFVFDIVEFMA